MLRKRQVIQKGSKKNALTKQRHTSAKKGVRFTTKYRLSPMSLDRLRRAQFKTLRPVYSRLYRLQGQASAADAVKPLLARVSSSKVARARASLTSLGVSSGLRSSVLLPVWRVVARRGRHGAARVALVARKVYYTSTHAAVASGTGSSIYRNSARTLISYNRARRLRRMVASSGSMLPRQQRVLNYMLRRGYAQLLRRRVAVVRSLQQTYRTTRFRLRNRRIKKLRRRLRRQTAAYLVAMRKREARRRARLHRVSNTGSRFGGLLAYRHGALRTIAPFKTALLKQKQRVVKRHQLRRHFSTKLLNAGRYLSALRYRLQRSNPRGWIGPVWRRRRRGRRMFAGLFGKRRFRIERRDKVLFKRAARRQASKQTLYSVLSSATSGLALARQERARTARGAFDVLAGLSLSAVDAVAPALRGLGTHASVSAVRRNVALLRSSTTADKPDSVVAAVRSLQSRRRRALVSVVAFASTAGRRVGKLRTTRYNEWRAAVASAKLSRQRALRAAELVGSSANTNVGYLLTSTPHSSRLSRNTAISCGGYSGNIAPSTVSVSNALPAVQGSVSSVTADAASAWTSSTFLTKAVALQHSPIYLGVQKSTGQVLSGARARRQYVARRLQSVYPALRLPGSTMTRRRSRRGGRGLFFQNTLKTPVTLAGRAALLLPPVGAYSASATAQCSTAQSVAGALLPSLSHDDDKPRFWFRPPTRANLKSVYALRLRRLQHLRRRASRVQQLTRKSKEVCVASSNVTVPVTTSVSSLSDTPLKSSMASMGAQASTRRLALARKGASALSKAGLSATEYRVSFSKSAAAGSRVTSLWYSRSAREMLRKERALCAWTPQLSSRKRRWSYPRVNGVPLPRKRVSFKAERERIRQNANLLLRNLPQRKYVDYGATKLQFKLGSSGALGFKRIRRVHRAHTVYSRWWYPVKHGVPFAHPFSRRALAAKQYVRTSLRKAAPGALSGVSSALSGLAGISVEHKFPARTIPWRNFRFRRPRRGMAPNTLQRWTAKEVLGRTPVARLPRRLITVQRTAREVRSLESFFASSNAWGGKAWLALDPALAGAVASQAFSTALQQVPAAVWVALRKSSASAEAYAVTQRVILQQLRLWVNKQVGVYNTLTSAQLQHARNFVLSLVSTQLNSQSGSVIVAQQSAQRHAHLRNVGFARRTALKSTRYLSLRELPRVTSISKAVNNPAALQTSVLKKHWLRGAERLLRRSQLGYTPPGRSRYTSAASVAFGRRRVRFPASGRRRGSFDSLLHAFVKRTSPARFRRASALRFKAATPRVRGDFRWNLLTTANSRGAARRRVLVQKLATTAYLSSTWRRILSYRLSGASNTPVAVGQHDRSKRRFAALPVNALFANARRARGAVALSRKHPMYAVRAGILRRALRRRRDDRVFADLYKAVLSRKTPRDQAAPANKLRRAAKRKLSSRAGSWSRRGLVSRTPTKINWTLCHLSATGPRIVNLAAQPATTLPSGEVLSALPVVARRNRRAFRGFSITASTAFARRLRRKKRDSRKRHRGYKRRRPLGVRAVLCRIRHWSERKSSRRLLQYGLQKRRVYVARFAASLRSILPSTLRGVNHIEANATRSRLSRFVERSRSTAVVTDTAVRSSANPLELAQYLAAASVVRKSRRRLLSRKSRLTHLKYRTRGRLARTTKTILRAKKQQLVVAAARPTTASRLVATYAHETLVSPLFFQRPVTAAIKSVGAKNKAILASITSKEARYKVTAQYAESLLEFIPALINQMISKKINKGVRITYKTAQYLIRNIYWSLRVYLNVDPFDSRFELRELKPAARVQLAETIMTLSASQKTEQPQRAMLRRRFQPGRLTLAANTTRFRGDWLRAFFPEKHALYQEDPEDYGLFLFRTRDIRRLRMGGRDMSSWRTAHAGVSHETRARQVLTLRYSRATPRFETLLQTLRRTPQTERAPVALSGATRESFFVRHHSTFAHRQSALSTRWLHRRKRFVSFENKWRTISPVTAVAARRSILPRLEARGRTNYVAAALPSISTSFIDARFARAKSPRSRQYMLRVPTQISAVTKAVRFARVRTLRVAQERHVPAKTLPAVWTRRGRRSVFTVLRPAASVVGSARTLASVRRLRTSARTSKVSGLRADGITALLQRGGASRSAAVVAYTRSRLLPQAAVRLTKRARRLVRENGQRTNLFGDKQFPRVLVRRRPAMSSASGASLRNVAGSSVGALVPAQVVTRPTVAARGGAKFFKNRAGLQLVRRNNFALACAKRVRARRQTAFDSYRPRLWDKLTLRWMKKFRIGRYWIRDTSRWLRDPWLSQIVACDMNLRPDRAGGELRAREQQIGEYVADVDASGRDIPEAKATFRERFSASEQTAAKAGASSQVKTRATSLTGHRLQISRIARRKPVPAMWLANYEYRDAIREHKEEKTKSKQQKAEEETARVAEYWRRKAANLPEEKPRRAPLKHPANLWLPRTIWNEIQRRVRRFEWRESDEVFFRPGFRYAFRFYPSERNRAPWLEHLMYTRATYSTRLHEFRRWQFPREQKKYKWLQRVRKFLYPSKLVRYIKGRRWPQLRRYNQKLHYSLFNLPDRSAARRHFEKLNRRSRPAVSGFVSASAGLSNRLDVTLMKLGVAPSIYWARIVAKFCLLRVNGVRVSNPAYLLQPGDILQPEWDMISRFQHYFKPQLKRREAYQRRNRVSTTFYPGSIEYHRGTRTLVYKHAPDEADLRRSSRLQPTYFRWFKLDSV